MRKPTPETILSTYSDGADIFASSRNRTLFELPMLRAIVRHAKGRDVADIGCGTGQPLATWMARRGFRMTGIDGAKPMLAHYHRNVVGARIMHQDMRYLALNCRFDVLLAWDSFFHLSPHAQL